MDFINATRKAWAAAATVFGAGYTEAVGDGVTGDEWIGIIVATVVAWVVTWAIPNKEPV